MPQWAYEVTAFIGPDRRGVLLALTEAYQGLQNPKEAITCLRQLRKLDPEDVAVRLSLAELLMETQPEGKKVWKEVIQLAEDIDNDSAVHTAMLLYKAQALRQLGLLDAASSLLTTARRRKKDRSDELLNALQYERALVYEAQGKEKNRRVSSKSCMLKIRIMKMWRNGWDSNLKLRRQYRYV